MVYHKDKIKMLEGLCAPMFDTIVFFYPQVSRVRTLETSTVAFQGHHHPSVVVVLGLASPRLGVEHLATVGASR